MVQGTSSNVGKSLIATALCRLFRQEGYRVAPFKAQNMSLNSYVTAAGEEVARAQALQAEAAGAELCAHMNPLLLKPKGNRIAQVIVHGRPAGDLDAVAYRANGFHRRAWAAVRGSLAALQREYDILVIEGAGSPAEVNLRRTDLANMRVARAAGAAVLLVGDVDRGGVFASLLGTLRLLTPSERRLVAGLVVNKFRGDPRLFDDGVTFLESRARKPVLGVLPWIEVDLEEEDGVALERAAGRRPGSGDTADRWTAAGTNGNGALDVAVIRFPLISNFTDLDALTRTPGVRVRYVDRAEDLGEPDAIVLPGSKNTSEDLLWLQARGLAALILARARAGTPVAGICGGYQALGLRLLDPGGYESAHPEVAGLGLLTVETVFTGDKVTVRASGQLAAAEGPFAAASGEPVHGYEIHAGRTSLRGGLPLLRVTARGGRPAGDPPYDGCISADGRVFGTYFHGIFDNDGFRLAWVNWLRARRGWGPGGPGLAGSADRERELDRLADWVRTGLRLDVLRRAMGLA